MSWAGLFGWVESGRHTTRECARAAAVRFGRQVCPLYGSGARAPLSRAPGAPLDFSLSRSGPHWLLAVTAGAKIGVDIEPLDSAVGVADVALTEDERADAGPGGR
ncbi:hypothetical protein ACIPQH_17815 [Streptomyces rubiginosohelvolus]|uniref:hypothetical protein n=1 Tax=Streptomyces TaxID=1883 RepID=UPI001CD5CA61|nr:hypothetical protein [Streptomyces sp. 7G]MCA1271682.1 hypothetical protein [Streptomyces sp. 7G]